MSNSTRKANEVDEELRGHPRDAAHDRASLIEDAVAVRDRGDVVGDDRASEIAVLVENQVARRVAALVHVADHRTRGRRELHAHESALAAQGRCRDLDCLPVRHADEAEIRVHLDNDGLAGLDQARKLHRRRDVGRARAHREPDHAEDDEVDGHGCSERRKGERAGRGEDERNSHDRRNGDREDQKQEAEVVERPQRWNSSWMRRTAFSRSFSNTTSEMLSSLDPWAIATTFTLAFPSAVKTRAATPGVPRIPSPTAATMATGRSTSIFSTSWRWSSALNIFSSAPFRRSVASSGTTRHIEFSLDDWLIIITDIRSAAAVSNTRAANPGTPLMPAPCTVIMPRPPSDVVALTTLPSLSVLLGIVVPRSDGAKVFRIWTGIPASTADRKSTRLNSSHQIISYAVFCLKKKK